MTYDAFGRTLTLGNGAGSITTTYNDVARSVTVTTAEGISTSSVRNAFGELVSVTDGRGNTTTYSYNLDGQVTSITEPAGTKTTSYDAAGQQLTSTDRNGVITSFTYDVTGRVLSKSVDPTGLNITTNYRYDALGRAVWVQDANGIWTRTDYDDKGQVTMVEVDPVRTGAWVSGADDNPAGLALKTTYTYDAGGRLVTVTEGAGSTAARTTQYTYDALSRRTKEVVDPAGLALTTQYSYDDAGNLVKKVDANGNSIYYGYDVQGRQTVIVDATGAVTRKIYDAQDRVVAEYRYAASINTTTLAAVPATGVRTEASLLALLPATPSFTQTQYAYDADERLVYTVDAIGVVRKNTYDANGNVTARTTYATPIALVAGTSTSTIAAAIVTNAADQTVIFTYDAANRVQESRDGLNIATRYTYNAQGHVASTTVAHGTPDASTTVYVHDNAGRVTDVIEAYGTSQAVTRHASYDAMNQIIAESAAYGTPFATTTHYAYDAAGRRVEKTTAYGKPEANTELTAYDALGNPIKITDPNGKAGYFWFDKAGRTILAIDPEGYATKTEYNSTGAVLKITRYASPIDGTLDIAVLPFIAVDPVHDQVTLIAYDALNRQTKLIDAEGFIETTVYDAFGNKVAFTNKLGGIFSYSYDQLGRLVSETLPITASNGQGDQFFVQNRYSYDARGNRTQRIEAYGLPEARTTTWTYDKLDRAITQSSDAIEIFDSATNSTTQVIPTETRSYDARGNLIAVVTASGARTLTFYDAFDRQIASVDALGHLSIWTYNAAGDVVKKALYADPISTSQPLGGATPQPANPNNVRETIFTYDNNHRLLTTTIKNVVVGNRNSINGTYEIATADLTTTYIYDHNGNVVQTIDARGNSTFSYYDNLGNKILEVDTEGYVTAWAYQLSEKPTSQIRYANKLSLIPTSSLPVTALISNVAGGAQDRISEYDYDRMGRLVEAQTFNVASGALSLTGVLTSGLQTARSTYSYNGLGLLTQQNHFVSSNTIETTDQVYDNIGRLTKELKPIFVDFEGSNVRPTTEFEYDGLNNIKREIIRGKNDHSEIDDRITIYMYGNGGRLSSITDATGAITSYEYDASGRITRIRLDRTDADGNIFNDATVSQYDALGREIKRTKLSKSSLSNTYTTLDTQESLYNAFSEIIGKRTNGGNASGSWQEIAEYDNAGRAWKSNSGGAYKAYVFDANGNATLTVSSSTIDLSELTFAQIQSLPTSSVQFTINEYDRRNQLTSTFDPTIMFSQEKTTIGQFIVERTGYSYSSGSAAVQNLTAATTMPSTTGSAGSMGSQVSYSFDCFCGGGGEICATEGGHLNIMLPDTSALGTGNIRIVMGQNGGTKYFNSSSPTTVRFYWPSNVFNASVYKETPYGLVYLSELTEWASSVPRIPNLITFRDQPAATSRLVMQYRSSATAGWSIMNVPQLKNTSGSNIPGWYGFDWSTFAQGNYEFRYVALDSSGNILNSEAGNLTINTKASITQTAQPIGGLGRSFMDNLGNLHIVEQGAAAQSMRLRYRTLGGEWSNAIVLNSHMIAGVNTPGWFVFNPAAYGLSGTYEYQIESYTSTGGSGTLLRKAGGSFTAGNANSVTALNGLSTVRLSSQPLAATNLIIRYRPENSTSEYTTAHLQPTVIGSGTFDWDISGLAAGRYEYSYEVHDSGGAIINKAHGLIQSGSAPQVISHVNDSTPTVVSFSVANTNAHSLALHYRVAGSQGNFVTVSPRLQRTSTSESFVWDASSLLGTNSSLSLDYYYELYDLHGSLLKAVTDALSPTDDIPIRVSGHIDIGTGSPATQIKWLNSTTFAESINITKKQSFNAFGEVIQEIDGRGNITDFIYNSLGHLIAKLDPLTNVTLENGYIQRERPTTRYTYDLQGRLIAIEDANGNLSRQSWLAGSTADTQNVSVQTEWHADGGVRQRGYDVFGNLIWDEDQIGRRTQYEYDELGRVQCITRPTRADGQQAVDQYEYDAAGNRTAHTNALGNRERTYFDALGRIIQTLSYKGIATTYNYSYLNTIANSDGTQSGGYQKITVEASGHTSIDRIDIFGRLIWRQDLGGHIYQYGYNQAGWLISQTSSAGQNITYDYYENGFLRRINDLALRTETLYEYDANGNRTREIYKREINIAGAWTGNWDYQQNAEITYDELNRVIRILDPKSDIRYEYDANSNRMRTLSYYHDGLYGNATTQDYWYRYDLMNRFTLTMGTLSTSARGTHASDNNVTIISGNTGVAIQYNAAGERMQAIYGEDNHAERYTYSEDGYLISTELDMNASNGLQWNLQAARTVDLLGRTVEYREFNQSQATTLSRRTVYDADSQILQQQEWDGAISGNAKRTTTYDYYDRVGNDNAGPLYRSTLVDGATTVNTYYQYEWWDEAKTSKITATPYNHSSSNWKSGDSRFDYDVNGHLLQVDDPAARQNGMGRTIRYVTNAQGLILDRSEIAGGTADANGVVTGGSVSKNVRFYYLDGKRVGDVGNDATGAPVVNRQSYAEQLAQSNTGNKRDQYRNWKPIASADFDQNYQPINRSYPSATASSYTVRTGDTLQSIAAAMWGDASLWYIVADANGLTASSSLTEGTLLTIPNKVTNVHNNSQTFQVYNAGEAIGDTSPTLPEAPPPPRAKEKCGGLGQIIVIIVTIVVAVYAPQLIPALQGASPAVAGAVSAAVGNVAGQATGMAIGVQDSFSWKSVAMSAIGGYISGGITGTDKVAGWGWAKDIVPSSLQSGWQTAAARAVIGNVTTQGIGVVSGLQQKFDWRGVAAAGIGAGVGEHVRNATAGTDYSKFASRLASGVSAGAVLSSGRFDSQTTAGVIGNLIGESISDKIVSSKNNRFITESDDPLGDFINAYEKEWDSKYGAANTWNISDSVSAQARSNANNVSNTNQSIEDLQDADPNKVIDPARAGLYHVHKVMDKWMVTSEVDSVQTNKAAMNGMLNESGYGAWLMSRHIEAEFGDASSFTLFYNPTEGLLKDSWESLQDKLGFTTDIAKQFSEVLKNVQASGHQVDWVVHSQAGIIFSEAARVSGANLSNNRVSFHSGGNNQWVTNNIMQNAGIRVINYQDHPFDPVSNIAGLNTLNPIKIIGSVLALPLVIWGGPEQSPHTLPYIKKAN